MAEIQYGGIGVAPTLSRANLTWLVNWLGGLISVTLIAGLVFWGYQLMLRDVSGIPVVRALEGPMRVTPVDPGGSSAAHQGLAVNNIAAVGEAEAPADRLVLAPKPTAINGNDPTAAELRALKTEPVVAAPEINGADVVAAVLVLGDAQEVAVVPDQASLIEATLRTVEVDGATVAPRDLILASVAGVSRSLYPVTRPPAISASGADAAAPADGGVRSFDPADIAAGTRLVQLGAFESVDNAKGEWLKIASQFDVFMADKARVIEAAQSGGKVFYRLRAHGFDDLADARRFCSTLLAGQANCIPVLSR